MHRALALGAVVVAAVATAPVTSAAASAGDSHALPAHSQRAVCGTPAPKAARCFAHVVTHKDSAAPLATVSYQSGYNPADLASAYQLPTASGTPGAGPTVAIVDAYDNPNAQSDLNAYRSQFGLGACNSGCFTKVNQNGQATPLPTGDTGWGAEIDLDLDMVSAACPTCKILLVEANSNNFSDLMTAASYAVNNAKFVSNSYGGNEFSGETSYDSTFNKPGVAVTVSSGDNGYGVQYPAASQYVTAVGGTSLSRNASVPRGWSETAWSGAGSGCSALESKPPWQHDTLCTRRTVADVSAVANPNTGVAVYDSYGSSGGANWFVYGGTSVASPFVAAVWALAPAGAGTLAQVPYGHTAGWNDVTSGTNTSRCRSGYLCQAGAGYDGPTGLGTPIGASGFGGTVGSGGGGGGTNNPPTASFSYNCTNLSCTFADHSSDTDGTIASWSWTFGDGATSTSQNPSHSYASAGTYTVTLTVTDDGGASSTPAPQQVVASSGSVGGITLSASTSKPHRIDTVTLSWTGASGAVDVIRDGAKIATTSASSYTDSTGVRGTASFTYQVCNTGTTTCSNAATVTF